MITENAEIIRVYELEPKQKHPAIFRSFDKLEPGGSFIIENDHDPIPLYYELNAERNEELDKFEYLQKGPEIWRVQISKIGKDEELQSSCTILNPTSRKYEEQEPEFGSCSIEMEIPVPVKNENVLDVTILEPRHKHPTIFEWFGKLEPGKSFILKNDHDPKPLYYQMLGELGQVFNWEYMEKGPLWWIVEIQKKPNGEPTIGEMAAKDFRKAEAMRKMGIDFCCGGNKTLSQAAAEAGFTQEQFNTALVEMEQGSTGTTNSFDKWDADFLVDYIYNQHHKYFYEIKDRLVELSAKVKTVHSNVHRELFLLDDLVNKLVRELESHFYKEEKVVFPYIKEMVECKKNGTRPMNTLFITQGPLAMMHMEHEEAGTLLKNMRETANDYNVPRDACNSYRSLYNLLEELEGDLHQHIHLENNILFPKAMQIDRELAN